MQSIRTQSVTVAKSDRAKRSGFLAILCVAGLVALGALSGGARGQEHFTVTTQEVDDWKAVFATVQSADQIEARARISGRVAGLAVDEGSMVQPEQTIAVVGDEKLALRLQALDARIKGLQSTVATAKADLDRGRQLAERGVISAARMDQLRTAHEVADNQLRSAQAERSVVEREMEEGAVLAPAAGRVLKVPVKNGSFVRVGESIATIAADEYILRLELPERHAASIKEGDTISVGPRGLGTDQQRVGSGTIEQVYPELRNGRVLADARVEGLGDYFVGERALVWISVGKRQSIVIPRAYIFTRYGIDFTRVVKADGEPLDVVVQLGQSVEADRAADSVEVLSGLRPGDQLVKP